MRWRDRLRTMLRLVTPLSLPAVLRYLVPIHRRLPTEIDLARAARQPPPKATTEDLVALCELCARGLRSGKTPATSLIDAIHRTVAHDPTWAALARDIAIHHDLVDIVHWAESHADGDTKRCLSLLRSALVDRYMHAPALDHAAQILRETAACRRQIRAATAQVRLSVHILTGIPWVMCAGSWLFSAQFRAQLTQPHVLIPLLCGIVLNLAARSVMNAMSQRIERTTENTAGTPARLADDVAVALLAGLTPSAALRRLADDNAPHSVGSVVADRLAHGMPFERALAPLISARGCHHIGELLIQAHSDGVPSAHTAAELARDAHLQRESEIEELTRSLPVKMTLPLTVLALPSFLLIAVVPLLTSGMSTVVFPATPL